MKIFLHRDMWLVFFGGNVSLIIDSLTETHFVNAAINGVAAAISLHFATRTGRETGSQ